MTKITFYRSNGIYKGFKAEGHSSYGFKGNDIVCAAISVLTTNTVNSLTEINKEEVEVGIDDGLMIVNLKTNKEASSQVLFQSLVLGLESIQDEYGTKFCKVVYKEEDANVKA